MKKRVLSVLLAIVMVVGMFPVTAGALPAPHTHPVCGKTHTDIGDHTGTCEAVKWTAWNGTTDITYTDGTAYVYLSADVFLSGALVVGANQTLYLCLNDHVLDYNGNSASDAITVRDGGVLYLTDCCTAPTTRYGQWNEANTVYTISTSQPDGGSFDTLMGGVITGGGFSANLSSQTYNGGGVWVYNGTFYMYGGTIAGNTAFGPGGGVYVTNGADGAYGVFYLYDGTITGNRAANGGGLGVFQGEFYMSGGEITGNTATGSTGGGGVYVSESEFHMSGGSITDNRATANGGGVVLSYSNKSKFNMSGGSITGNSADKNGGGVYAPSSAYITVSGAPKIINNTKGAGDSAPANNLVPESYLRFTVSGTLGTGASIGIFRTAAGRFSAGGADSVSYFSSDNAGYKVEASGKNLTLVSVAVPVTDVSLSESSLTLDVGGTKTLTATVLPDDATDKTVIWTSSDNNVATVENGKVTALTPGSTTITATTTDGGFTATCAVTVSAPAETHSHPICGATCTHEVEHNTLDSWTKLTASNLSNGTLSLTDGKSYYLGEDITVSASVEISGTVNLCLNGHVLKYDGTDKVSVIKVASNATLSICDCTNTTHTGYINSDGLWEAGTPSGEEAAVTLTGGIITGGTGYRFYDDTSYYRYGGGIYVDGGTLNLYGGNIAGNLCAHEGDLKKYGGGGVYVKNGTFNMYDGTITGNCAMTKTNGGGGLYLDNSTFNMSGGKISHNKAYLVSGSYGGYGGGIYVFGSNSQANLSGTAEISGNSAYSAGGGINLATGSITMSGNVAIDGNEAQNGGGVSFKGNTFTINGGSISNNTATGSYGAGGVEMTSGSITMNDGSISNNTAAGTGGGVRVYDGTFTMAGGSISGNKTTGSAHGGGVYIYNNGSATFAMTAGKISGNTASGNGGGVYNDRVFQISGGEISGNIASVDGGGVYANKAVKLSGAPTISGNTVNENSNNVSVSTSVNIAVVGELTNTTPIGVTVRSSGTGKFASPSSDVATLANGYADKFQSDNPAYAVAVEDTYLILAEAPHSHDMSVACGGSGVTYTAWDGTGTPSGNVYLTDDVTLTETLTISSGTVNLCLNGHSITNSSGAAIEVKSGATLNICDCQTTAGTISATASGSTGIENYGILTVYGGTVSGNTYGICNNYGGNVAVRGGTVSGGTGIENYGTLTVSGGSVKGTHTSGGYGISTYGTFKLSGAPVITGGSNSADVLIHDYQKVITIDGTLTYSTPISVKPYNGYSAFTNGWNDKMPTADHKDYFIPASGKHVFVESSDELKPAYTVTYDANGAASGSVPVDSSSPYFYSNVVTVLDNTGGLAEEGYEFSGWNTKADGTGTHYAPDSTFTIYSNTTLYAVWKVPHIHEYTYAVNTENAAQIIESCTCGHSKTATLEIDTSVSTVYNGSAIKALKVSYSDGWVGDKNAEISYTNNTNAGTASGSVTIGGLTVTKSFTITKKSAEAPATPTAQNSITYGAELSEVGLTAGWTWADGNTIPTVNNSGYTAYYTPADVTNLDWTAVDGWNASAGRVERTVAVTVNKSAPTYTAPTGLTATYGDTLANVSLPSGWTWKTPSASVGNAGVNSFKAVFTPDDTDNYDTVEIDVIVTVGKADASYTTPTGLTATYGDTLADVSLPSGWTWKTPSASVGNVGINSFKAVYTPSDTDNFNAAEVDVSVTVGKANSSYTEPTAKELVYNGSAQTLVNAGSTTTGAMQYALGSITEPTGSWSATLPQGQNAGTYYIWYKVVGDENHNDVAPACVVVTIAKKQIAKPAADNSTFTYNGSYQTYAMNGDPAFIIDNNVQKNAGSYTVTATLQDTANYEWIDGTTAVLEYTFKIEQKEIDIGWDATMFLPYTGNSLLPKATATNLVDGDTCTLTTEVVETTEGAGVIPGEWTAKVTALSNNNYKLPASGVRVIVTFEIVNGYQNYAPVVSGTNETIDGKGDGKITGVDNTMEYRKEGEISYTAVSGSEVTGLHDGIYYVRYAAKPYYNPSPEAQLTIGAGRKLTVIVPQNQIGYTLITTTPELDYYGSIRVEFKLLPGYSMTENFEIYNGTEPIWQHFNQQTGILELTFVASDFDLTVAGVADISAPVAEIDIKNNKWTNFWNDITFGLFFNETQDVTITAADAGSGVNTIQYYLAGDELELDEVRAITDWVDYNGTFKIDPNNHYVVYAKITDNAGNTLYINSDGIVLDNIAPTLEGIENGKTYYGDLTVIKSDEQFYDIKMVTLDGEPMGFAEGTYGLIPADNAEHIVVVQDHAGNKTTYTVTVMKNYTVTYKADGIVVGTQIVGHGKDATAPDIPEKEGYTQTAPTWDKESTNITADTEINAVYTINKYTVTYKADGETVSAVEVEHGKDATAPAIPEKEGYTQTAPAWDKDGKNITADTEINAVYTINEYTITFMDENGVYKTLTYKHGEAVTMPEVPAKDGYTVTWDTTIEKATGNATVNAVYTKNAVSDNPQTGDNSNLWLWWILLIVSAASITVLCIEQKKRRATK